MEERRGGRVKERRGGRVKERTEGEGKEGWWRGGVTGGKDSVAAHPYFLTIGPLMPPVPFKK